MHMMYRHNTKTLFNWLNTLVQIRQQGCIWKELISSSLGWGKRDGYPIVQI